MRGAGGNHGKTRALATCLALSLTSACAARTSYMGISLRPGEAPADVQALAQRARGGDKQAQLELGIAFEEGREVFRDLGKARALYRLASTDSRAVWVYTPSPGNGAPSRVESVDVGTHQHGLQEAKSRLERISSPFHIRN